MNDHRLNALLAKVAGVELFETAKGCIWNVVPPKDLPPGELFIYEEWTPLTDHNQMALVKAALREQGWGYQIDAGIKGFAVWIINDDEYYSGEHKDELAAFGNAVAKMTEQQP